MGNCKPFRSIPKIEQQKEENTHQTSTKFEEKINANQTQIQILEDKIRQSKRQIDLLKEQAQEKIDKKKFKQAKQILLRAAKYKQQSQNYQNQKKALFNQKIQLENTKEDKEALRLLQKNKRILEQKELTNEKMDDIIYKTQKSRVLQNDIDSKFKSLVSNDDIKDETDDMMRQIIKEMKAEKMMKVHKQNVKPFINNQNSQLEDEITKMIKNLG